MLLNEHDNYKIKQNIQNIIENLKYYISIN